MTHLPVRGLVVACVLALPVSLSAQSVVQSPLSSAGAEATGLTVVTPNAGRIAALAEHHEIILTGLPMPGGETLDLELTRVDLSRMTFGYQVNGAAAPGLADGLDLTLWTGTVAGDPNSDVMLSFSNVGTRGWIEIGDDLVHVMPQPGANNDWTSSYAILAREADLQERGMDLDISCGTDLIEQPMAELRPGTDVEPPTSYAGTCSGWECKMAIETDYQLFQIFNNLGAETAYVTTLLGAISSRYEEQINTILTFPYLQFYTNSNDPWSTPESGGSMIDMLGEFESAWAGNVPGGAVLGHFVSGASLGGGVAYLSALCDTSHTFSFAVSGNLAGVTPFPIQVDPLNWDFMVIAHETGHNFSSPHTHDLGIDNCAGGSCITDGTIMSYCHQCPGGMLNITTYFDVPTVVPMMMSHASTCLPSLEPLSVNAAAQPTLIAEAMSTTVGVTLLGTAVGSVDLNYRLNGGSFTAVAMTPQGGGFYEGSIPGPACGDSPEWFFSVTDQACGLFQTATFSAEVGSESVVSLADFETSAGWSVGAPGDDATTGIWTRGNPIGTGAQPENDVTDPGTNCWFTGQGTPGGGLGENDIDGGKTSLTSSTIDLSGGDARISYWRWYSNNTGSAPSSDTMLVEMSNNGGSSWSTVETVGPTGAEAGGGWFYHEFLVSDVLAATGNMQLRFVASDEGSGSVVEAALDEVKVFRVDCGGGIVCQTDLGFGGPGTGSLSLCGGDLSTGTTADLDLTAAAANETAFLFAGFSNSPTPVKGGMLVPVPWVLSVGLPIDGSGNLSLTVPGGNGPLTLYVQYVYTDPGQVKGYGFSNALEVNLLP